MCTRGLEGIRMEEVFEQPSAKNRHGAFGKPSLRSPTMWRDTELLKCPLLPEVLVDKAETGNAFLNKMGSILLPQCSPGNLNLCIDCILQASKVTRNSLVCKRSVELCSPPACYSVERRRQQLQMFVILLVPSIHLQNVRHRYRYQTV